MPNYVKYIGPNSAKKKKLKRLICPLCKKECLGRETFSRHISHAHNKIDPVKREKIVIDKFFGAGVVKKVIDAYKNREYSLNGLPIDIVKYIHLANIKPVDIDDNNNDDEDKKNKSNIKVVDLRENYPVIKVIKRDENETTDVVAYVYDAIINENGSLVFLTTSSIVDTLSFQDIKRYVKNIPDWKKIKKEHILVQFNKTYSKNDKIFEVTNIQKRDFDDIDKEHRDRITLIININGNKEDVPNDIDSIIM